MKAAVVRSFDSPPRYEDFDLPPPKNDDELVVDVLAAGLHPRVRSAASGTHYDSDHVGRLANGKLVYCVVHDVPYGTMAAQVVADRRRCVPLPDGIDEAVVAAGMNPGMSSWIALKLRAPIQPGQSVFVLGASGNAGRMAIAIAKLLGAGRVVGAAREIRRLEASGADEIVSLVGDATTVRSAIAKAASESDIVIDYLWGQPAADAMMALLTARQERDKPIAWIQIGSVAGPTMALPSVALRSTNLQVMGSGQGSVSVKAIVAELPRLADELTSGRIAVDALRVPLADVEKTWTAEALAGRRVVLIP
jgi:NADPH:quinone reductase-like Zn-dependent oxidoreductase